MLQSVVKPATVLFAAGFLASMADQAEAQFGRGYRHSSRYTPAPYEAPPGYFNDFSQPGSSGSLYAPGSDEEFIYSLYVNVLGREPEPYEVTPWARNMRILNLSRPQVVWMFRNSREYLGKHGYGGQGGPAYGTYSYPPYGGYGSYGFGGYGW